MNYHNITKDDMLNGEGLRVVLWVSGCDHYCKGCQNPQTHDKNSGLPFTYDVIKEIIEEVNKDHIKGLTISGGDPLFKENREDILNLVRRIKRFCRGKDIWIYTGHTLEEIENDETVRYIFDKIDTLVDGKYDENCTDIKTPWVGSYNQRIINMEEWRQKEYKKLFEESREKYGLLTN